MNYPCVGWEVVYTGDMVHTSQCGQDPGQGHVLVSDKHEKKVGHEDVSLTPISSPIPSGTLARGRAQSGSPSSCMDNVGLGNSSSDVTAA